MNEQDLIERLSNSTGPDRALDAEIAKVCGVQWSSDEDGNFGGYGIMPRRVRFTESLDSALSIDPQVAYARLMEALAYAASYFVNFRDSTNAPILRMLPIFVCIAALKARAHQRTQAEAPARHLNPPT